MPIPAYESSVAREQSSRSSAPPATGKMFEVVDGAELPKCRSCGDHIGPDGRALGCLRPDGSTDLRLMHVVRRPANLSDIVVVDSDGRGPN